MEKQKFNFKCYDCKHLFTSELGRNCPNCGSMDVRIVTELKLLKYFFPQIIIFFLGFYKILYFFLIDNYLYKK